MTIFWIWLFFSLVCLVGFVATAIFCRKHEKKGVRMMPIWIAMGWAFITGILLLVVILTQLGLASQIIVQILLIMGYVFLICAVISGIGLSIAMLIRYFAGIVTDAD